MPPDRFTWLTASWMPRRFSRAASSPAYCPTAPTQYASSRRVQLTPSNDANDAISSAALCRDMPGSGFTLGDGGAGGARDRGDDAIEIGDVERLRENSAPGALDEGAHVRADDVAGEEHEAVQQIRLLALQQVVKLHAGQHRHAQIADDRAVRRVLDHAFVDR